MAKQSLKEKLNNLDKLKKIIDLFERKTTKRINRIQYTDIQSTVHSVLALVIRVTLSKELERVEGRKKSKATITNEKFINESIAQYEKYRTEILEVARKAKKTIHTTPSGKNYEVNQGDLIRNSVRLADNIIDDIQKFIKSEKGIGAGKFDIKLSDVKERKSSKMSDATAIGLSAITGSVLPMMVSPAIQGMKDTWKKYKTADKSTKRTMVGHGLSSGIGMLAGSPGLLMLGSMLEQKTNESIQRKSDVRANQKTMRQMLSNIKKQESPKAAAKSKSLENNANIKRQIEEVLMQHNLIKTHSAKSGGVFSVEGGSDSGIGSKINNLRVHKGETVVVKPAKDETLGTLKSIDKKLEPLGEISKSNDLIAFTAEETLEDARDRTTREGLISKKETKASSPLVAAMAMKKEEEKKEKTTSLIDKASDAIMGKLANPKFMGAAIGAAGGGYAGYKAGGWISEQAGFEKGGTADNIATYGGAALGAVGGGLLGSKIGGMFGGKEGQPVYVTNLGEISTGGGFGGGMNLGRLGKAAGVAGMVTTAAAAGWGLGTLINDKLLTNEKGESRIFGGVDTNKEQDDKLAALMAKNQATREKLSISTNSNSMAINNVSNQQTMNTTPQVIPSSKKVSGERSVNDIKNNTQGLSHVSESSSLKVAETKVDMANLQKVSKTTKDAINNINIKAPAPQQTAPSPIIFTGDMDSFATRLAKSY